MNKPNNRQNYDSIGISTGNFVGQIFADLELQIIKNRTRMFRDALKDRNNSFKQNVYAGLDQYRRNNANAIVGSLKQVKTVAQEELNKAYKVGQNTVDKTVRHYEKQGFKPKQKPTGESVFGGISLIMGIFAGMGAYGAANADRQLFQIINSVNENAENLPEEIDRVQQPFLERGIAGKRTADGKEKNIVSEAEFIMRDQSQKTILEAEGERAKEYGLNPLVQISAHPSSCELCSPWQGRVLIDDVYQNGQPDGKHELLSTAINAGLYHYNCRHNHISYVEGKDKPSLFERDRDTAERTAKRYAIEQQQRYNERNIRDWKKKQEGLLTEQEKLRAKQKLGEWNARQQALSKLAEKENLPFYRQYSREDIGGKTKPKFRA